MSMTSAGLNPVKNYQCLLPPEIRVLSPVEALHIGLMLSVSQRLPVNLAGQLLPMLRDLQKAGIDCGVVLVKPQRKNHQAVVEVWRTPVKPLRIREDGRAAKFRAPLPRKKKGGE